MQPQARERNERGGFTLVELIVVLVILAILAAMLVPTLIGYINNARIQKDYLTAETVREAAQSVADDQYAHGFQYKYGTRSDPYSIDVNDMNSQGQQVVDVAGLTKGGQPNQIKGLFFHLDKQAKIINGEVDFNDGHICVWREKNGQMVWTTGWYN